MVFIKGHIRVEPPKSEAGIRDVAIPPHLIPIVREHLETHAAPGQEGLFFPSDIKRQQWPSTVTGYFKNPRAELGHEFGVIEQLGVVGAYGDRSRQVELPPDLRDC